MRLLTILFTTLFMVGCPDADTAETTQDATQTATDVTQTATDADGDATPLLPNGPRFWVHPPTPDPFEDEMEAACCDPA